MPKEKYIFSFECVKKKHKFQVEGEDDDMKQFDVPEMRCPVCQKDVQFSASNFAAAGLQKSIENIRKENIERSNMAMEMARQHSISNPSPEMKELQYGDIPGKGGGTFNRPEKVPVEVIRRLEEKIAPHLD
jgi:hypothetical protein